MRDVELPLSAGMSSSLEHSSGNLHRSSGTRWSVRARALVVGLLAAAGSVPAMSAGQPAESLGTFRWQLQPYGSVLNLTVVQQGSIYLLDGFEAQCGGNASLPVSGVAIAQANGTVMIGVTSINEQGRGLHTRATINTSDFNGSWSDNAGNTNQTFLFNPGNTCPGGPRTGPTSPDQLQTLQDQIAELTERLKALERR